MPKEWYSLKIRSPKTTILITGSAGFIGFNLAKKLLQEGNRIIGIDNLNSDYDPSIKEARVIELQQFSNFEFLKIDIVHDDVLSILKGRNVSYFVHLAARDFYYNHPLDLKYSLFVESQVLGTARMFELAKKLAAKKFVYASTHSVYGKTKKGILTEKKILPSPISPHGASKLAAEEVVRFLSNYYKLPSVILRISSVYGPNMTPHMLIPSVIRNLKEGSKIRKHVNFTKSTRDFIYIDDVVNYIISTFDKRVNFQVINIGSGKSVTLSKLVDMIAELLGKKVKEAKVKSLEKEYKHIIVGRVEIDISRAKKILRYTPQTELEEGLQKTVDYFTTSNP